MTAPRKEPSWARKLAWFVRGTKRQQARPIPGPINEQKVVEQVHKEIEAQFRQAEKSSRLRLDLRKQLRVIGREVAKTMAATIRLATPKKRPDGRTTGGTLGTRADKNVKVGREGFRVGGKKTGAVLNLLGIRLVEGQLRDLAARRLRSEGGIGKLVRDLERLEREAVNLERQSRGRS